MSAWNYIGRADGNGSSSSIQFSNIPGTYSDLVIKYHLRSTTNTYFIDGNFFTVNGSNSGYSWIRLWNTASSGGSGSSMSFGLTNGGLTSANSFTVGEMYIPGYAGSHTKTFSYDSSTETNTTVDGNYLMIYSGSWSNTQAITSISFGSGSGNFATGSFIELYGVLHGSSGGVTVS